MHDSGTRREFTTGAVRDTAQGKPRPDLISPYAQLREGEWMRLGAEKYNERNWEKGIPISRCIESLERHLLAYKMGDLSEDHMAAVRTNASFILHFEEMIQRGLLPAELDDMPKYEQQRAINRVDTRPHVYISGPMRGYKAYNFNAFLKAGTTWQERGFAVMNPAQMDLDAGMPDPRQDMEAATAWWEANASKRMNLDIEVILEMDAARGDRVIVLPGWQDSTGARAEVFTALFKQIPVFTHEAGVEITSFDTRVFA